MNTRFDWVDYTKGFGILLVVYGHVLRGLEAAHIGLNKTFFYVSDTFIYGFHMPLFFFVAGLFVERWVNKYSSYKEAVFEKVKTILWPYILWSLIQGCVNVLLSSMTNSSITWNDLAFKILFRPFGQFWFLYVLFIQYLFVLSIYKRFSLKTILIISGCIFLTQPYLSNYWVLGKLFGNTIFLCLGLMVNKIGVIRLADIFMRFRYQYIATIFFTISIFYVFEMNNLITGFLVAISGILFIIRSSIILSNHKLVIWVKELGILTMPIYLLHIFFASGVRIILEKFIGNTSVLLHLLIGTLCGVFLPMAIYKLFKKLTITKYIFGR